MKIYIIEKNNNKEIYNYLIKKHDIVEISSILEADVILVNKVRNIKNALDIVDYALMNGKEILCIKNNFNKEYYVTNYLIKDGAMHI